MSNSGNAHRFLYGLAMALGGHRIPFSIENANGKNTKIEIKWRNDNFNLNIHNASDSDPHMHTI